MLKHRIIPCLLIDEGRLVKTIKFSDPKYVGDPINAIRIFNEKQVDELIVLDISASKYRKDPNYKFIERLAGECFMPICYGGGVKTPEQAQTLFSIGVEKVSIQSAAIEDISIISKITERFGCQSVVSSIDVKVDWWGRKKLYNAAKTQFSNIPWKKYLTEVISAGAGEILLNAVDRDGTMLGMDANIISEASELASVPLIAIGGVGRIQDIVAGIKSGASAVGAGSFFVFHGPHRAVLITYPEPTELETLMRSVDE